MATRAVHRVGHNRLMKGFAEALRSNCRVRRGESRAKFSLIQVLAKTRCPIRSQTIVGVADGLSFTRRHAAINGKNRKDTGLVAFCAIVRALSQFPAPIDSDRGAPAVCPEIILKISL